MLEKTLSACCSFRGSIFWISFKISNWKLHSITHLLIYLDIGKHIINSYFKQLKNLGEIEFALKSIGDATNNYGTVSQAVANLSKQNTIAVLTTTALSQNQIKQILISKGLTGAELEQAVATATLSASQVGATASTVTFTTVLQGLKVALLANPIPAIITGFTLLTTAISIGKNVYNKYVEEAIQKSSELGQKYRETALSMEEQVEKIKELKNQLADYSTTESEAYDIKSQLYEIQKNIVDTYGEEANGLNLVNGELEKQLGILGKLSAKEANKLLNDGDFHKGYEIATEKMTKEEEYYLGHVPAGEIEIGQEILDIAKEFEGQGLKVDSYDNGLSYEIKFYGNALDAEETIGRFMTKIRALKESIGDDEMAANIIENVMYSARGSYTNAKELVDKYKVDWLGGLYADMATKGYDDGDPGKVYEDYAESIDNLNKAFATGEGIEEAKTNYDSMKQSVDEVIKKYGEFTPLFDDMGKALNESALNMYDFTEKMLADDKLLAYAEELKNLGLEDIDLEAFSDTDGITEKGEQAFNGLKAAAEEYGISVDDLIGRLVELEYVQGKPKDNDPSYYLGQASKTTQEVTGEFDKLTEALNQQNEQGYVSSSLFSELAAINTEYNDCLEYQNGLYKINNKLAGEVIKKRSDEAFESLKLSSAQDKLRYYRLENEIKNMTAAQQGDINAKRAEQAQLAENIKYYGLLENQIQSTIDKYSLWDNVKSAPQTGENFNKSLNMMEEIQKGFDTGRVGDEKFGLAVETLIPDSVYKGLEDPNDQVAAIEQYYNSTASKYLTRDSENDLSGIRNFLNSSIEEGLISGTWDNFEINPDVKTEDFMEKLNLTREAVQSLFGEIEMYSFGDAIDFSDEAIRNIDDEFVSLSLTIQDLNAQKEELAAQGFTADSAQIKELDAKLETAEHNLQGLGQAARENIRNWAEEQGELNSQIRELNIEIYNLETKESTIGLSGEETQELEEARAVLAEIGREKDELNIPTELEFNLAASELIGDFGSIDEAITDTKQELERLSKSGKDTVEDINEKTLELMELEALKKIQIECGNTVDTTLFNENVIGAEANAENLKGTLEEIGNSIYNLFLEYASLENANKEAKDIIHNLAKIGMEAVTANVIINYSEKNKPPGETNVPPVIEEGKTDKNSTADKSGTVKYNGTANANGDWSIPNNQTSLVNELGNELLVRGGKWHLIEGGAQFLKLKRGDIIFNHKQTEQLFRHGSVTDGGGRGKMLGSSFALGSLLAKGKAMVTGGFQFYKSNTNNPASENASYDNSAKVSQSKAESNSTEKSERILGKLFNWIEIRLDRLSKATQDWIKKAETTIKEVTKKAAYNKAISGTQKEITESGKAYHRYMAQADHVGLEEEYKAKVREGTIDIEYIEDDGLKEKIQAYREYYEKAQACNSKIGELIKQMRDYAESMYNLPLDTASAKIEAISNKMDVLTAQYDNLNTVQSKNKNIDNQTARQKNIVNANKTASRKANKNLKSTSAALLKYASDANKESFAKSIRKKSEIDTSELAGNDLKNALKYNAALQAQKKATQELTLAQEEYTKAVRENTTAKYDNIATSRDDKNEKLSRKNSIAQAKMENAATAKNKNKHLDTLTKNAGRETGYANVAVTLGKKELNKSGNKLKKITTKENVGRTLNKSVDNAIKAGARISSSNLGKLKKKDMDAYNAAVKYNEALKKQNKLIDEATLALENETAIISKNTKAKYDNIAAERDEKNEELSTKDSIAEARMNNTSETKVKNEQVDIQTANAKEETKNAEEAAKEGQVILTKAGNKLKKSASNKKVGKALRSDIRKTIENGDVISDANLEKLKKKDKSAYKDAVKYNEALKNQKNLVNEVTFAVENETATIQNNTKAKYDNIKAEYDSGNAVINANIEESRAKINNYNAAGKSQTSTEYKGLYKNEIAEKEKLSEKKKEEYKKYSKDELERQLKNGEISQEDYNSQIAHMKQLETEILNIDSDIRDLKTEMDTIDLKEWTIGFDTLATEAEKLKDDMSAKEAEGKSITADDYQGLIDNSAEQIENLKEQNSILEGQKSNYEVNSEKYLELQAQIDSNNKSIREGKMNQKQWNKEISNIPINNLNKLLETMKKLNAVYDSLLGLRDAQKLDRTSEEITEQIKNNNEELSTLESSFKEYEGKYQKALKDGATEDEKKYMNSMHDLNAEILKLKTVNEGLLDSYIDIRIKALQKEMEALKKVNDVTDRRIALEKAQYEHEKLMNQRSQMVFNGKEFVYEVDHNAIRDSKKSLDDLKFNELMAEIEDSIEDLEGLKEEHNLYDKDGNLLEMKQEEIVNATEKAADQITGAIDEIISAYKNGEDSSMEPSVKDEIVKKYSALILENDTKRIGEDTVVAVKRDETMLKPDQFGDIRNLLSERISVLSMLDPAKDLGHNGYPDTGIFNNQDRSVNMKFGDIHVHEVKDGNELADNIIINMPNRMAQKLFQKR